MPRPRTISPNMGKKSRPLKSFNDLCFLPSYSFPSSLSSSFLSSSFTCTAPYFIQHILPVDFHLQLISTFPTKKSAPSQAQPTVDTSTAHPNTSTVITTTTVLPSFYPSSLFNPLTFPRPGPRDKHSHDDPDHHPHRGTEETQAHTYEKSHHTKHHNSYKLASPHCTKSSVLKIIGDDDSTDKKKRVILNVTIPSASKTEVQDWINVWVPQHIFGSDVLFQNEITYDANPETDQGILSFKADQGKQIVGEISIHVQDISSFPGEQGCYVTVYSKNMTKKTFGFTQKTLSGEGRFLRNLANELKRKFNDMIVLYKSRQIRLGFSAFSVPKVNANLVPKSLTGRPDHLLLVGQFPYNHRNLTGTPQSESADLYRFLLNWASSMPFSSIGPIGEITCTELKTKYKGVKLTWKKPTSGDRKKTCLEMTFLIYTLPKQDMSLILGYATVQKGPTIAATLRHFRSCALNVYRHAKFTDGIEF